MWSGETEETIQVGGSIVSCLSMVMFIVASGLGQGFSWSFRPSVALGTGTGRVDLGPLVNYAKIVMHEDCMLKPQILFRSNDF